MFVGLKDVGNLLSLYNAGYDCEDSLIKSAREIYTSVCSPAVLSLEFRWCDVLCQIGFRFKALTY